MAEGDIGAAIDTLEFDAVYGVHANIIHIAGDVYAIVATGPDGDGWLYTMAIAADGTMGASIIDSFEWDAVQGDKPRILPVYGDIYAIAYCGPGGDGWVKTYEIAADGTINVTMLDSLEFDTVAGSSPSFIHVDGNTFAIAYNGPDGDGWVCTVNITGSGAMDLAAIDTLEFDAAYGMDPNIIHIAGDVYAIVAQGTDFDGWVYTITIDVNGWISDAIVGSYEFRASDSATPRIIHISGNVYAIVYSDALNDGTVATITIADNGTITAAVISTLKFDVVNGQFAEIIHASGDVYAIVYTGADINGWMCTITIAPDGAIAATKIDTFEFDADMGYYPDIIHISGNVYAIAYGGTGVNGWLKTIDIETIPARSAARQIMMGMG